jgi:hypothetical protein
MIFILSDLIGTSLVGVLVGSSLVPVTRRSPKPATTVSVSSAPVPGSQI